MRRRVFVDTTGWLALANKGDHLHGRAAALNQTLLSEGVFFITTDYVLTEVANGLGGLRYRSAAVRFIEAIFSSKRIRIVQIDAGLFRRGWRLYRERTDKEWGLTDCTSFSVMTEEGIREALSCDRHFEQAGYLCLLEVDRE